MFRIALIGLGIGLLLAILAWAYGHVRYRARMADARAAWAAITALAPAGAPRFDPQTLHDQPEIARRYLTHAIAPGTPLTPVVALQMEGVFRLGNADAPRALRMAARQILAAPGAFVWIPVMRGNGMRIDGSDGLWRSHGWTRFWMYQAIPLARVGSDPDVDRSAAMRPALESVWAPAALHPDLGARWQQTGPDTARVRFGTGTTAIDIDLTLDAEGALRSLVGQRWSNANPDGIYRLQPFGGTALAEATFGGYTIPSHLAVGNHFGTDAYFAFFEVRVSDADFLTAP